MTDAAACRRLLDLTQTRGVDILQVNGQRLYGPPKTWIGPPPPRGCEVFVGRLPRDVFEDELVPLFERAGAIYNMRLMMDFSGSNRGYAFVQYQTQAAAQEAIKILNGHEIRPGKTVGVVRSADNCRLFVGNVPPDKTREEVLAELSRRVVGVRKVFLYPHPLDKARNRGYAFVEFDDHRSAAMARRELLPGRALLWGQRVNIDWAVPEPYVDDAVMQGVTNLYIRNLHLSTTEVAILEACESISGPESVMKVKKIKDFAFVHFYKREEAEKNLEYWNEREFDGSTIEVTWAKPVDKLQHVKRKPHAVHEMGLKLSSRLNTSDSMHMGRPVVKSRLPDSFDWSNRQPTLGSMSSGVFMSNFLEDFSYSAAPHFVPFTMSDGLTMPLLPQPDVHSSMAPGPVLAPSPLPSVDYGLAYPPPGYYISGSQVSSFEAPFYHQLQLK